MSGGDLREQLDTALAENRALQAANTKLVLAERDRLEAALRSAARTGPDVAVKPLDWDKHPDDEEWYSIDSGHYQVSDYIVYRSRVSTAAWLLRVRGHLLEQDFPTPEAAKAAAQADYEQRIRSAIAALSAPAGESVTGWQEITEDNQPPLDTPLLLGWLREWPECKWEVEAGWYGSTKGGWNHGQATHWMGQPLAPTITRKSEAGS